MDKPFSQEELNKTVELLNKLTGDAQNSIYADIFQMAAFTGMRAEPLLSLKYSDVKQVEGRCVVDINDAKVGLPAITYLPQAAIELIEKRRKENPDDKFIFESKSNRSKGKQIGRISVHRKFKEASDILQTNITFNSLRQRCVRNALKKFED